MGNRVIDRTNHLLRDEEPVDMERSLKQREWLRSPGIIERGLEAERQERKQWYDNLTIGQKSALGGFLVLLERNYGPGGEFTLP